MSIKKIGWLLGGVFLKKKRRTYATIFCQHRQTIIRGFKKKEPIIPDCTCSPIANCICHFTPRVEDIPDEHRSLLHAPQWAEIYAFGNCQSSTSAAGDRDMLGGWAAEGGERYLFESGETYKIAARCSMTVSMTFKSPEHDPLAEADDLDALGTVLESPGIVADEEILRTKDTTGHSYVLGCLNRRLLRLSCRPTVNMVLGEFTAR